MAPILIVPTAGGPAANRRARDDDLQLQGRRIGHGIFVLPQYSAEVRTLRPLLCTHFLPRVGAAALLHTAGHRFTDTRAWPRSEGSEAFPDITVVITIPDVVGP